MGVFKGKVRKSCLIKPIKPKNSYWGFLWVNGAVGCFILHEFEQSGRASYQAPGSRAAEHANAINNAETS